MRQFFDQTGTGTVTPRRYRYCPYCGSKLVQGKVVACEECHFVQYQNPLPGVSILVRNSRNEVLVGKRKNGRSEWCLPCGFIESGENFLEAAHREVKEETGLAVRITSVINVVSNVIRPDFESLVIVLMAKPNSGDLRPGDDITDLKWITGNDLPEMAFDADKYIISEFYRGTLSEIVVDAEYGETSFNRE